VGRSRTANDATEFSAETAEDSELRVASMLESSGLDLRERERGSVRIRHW
jgi:hypothetical protein